MSVLINVTDAAKLVAGSQKRRCAIIDDMNDLIKDSARDGNNWAHLPTGLSDPEILWIKEELILKGFTIKNTNPVVNW